MSEESRMMKKSYHIHYVCIEVALSGVPMGSGVQLGVEEGLIKSGSNVPTPPVPFVSRHTRWLILIQYCALSVANFTLGS